MRLFTLITIPTFTLAAILLSSSCGRTSDTSNSPLSTKTEYYTDPLGYRPHTFSHVAPIGTPIVAGPRHHDRIPVKHLGHFREVFLDSNKYQYKWAERIGISPIHSLSDAYRTRRPLVKISDCDAYGLDNLTHSLPYLVPEAADLLRTVGYDFIDTLAKRGVDGYKIKVTSLLRTPATVKSLRKINVNATDSSTHQFGTTFDISWTNFICADSTRTINEEDLKNVLAEVLYNIRAQGKCLVVWERKTGCFHVTVTPGRKPNEL